MFQTSLNTEATFAKVDKVPSWQATGVVYQINCGECSKTYVGQTGHIHHPPCERASKVPYSLFYRTSAIADHAMGTGHDKDITIREAWNIRQQPDRMNRDDSMLSTCYSSLILAERPGRTTARGIQLVKAVSM